MNSNTRIKVFKYRLYPSPSQEKNLFRVLNCARKLYNMALAERKYTYPLEGRKVGLAETEQLAKHYRATFPYADQLFSQTAQSVVKQVDRAYQACFRRLKAGERKAGVPRRRVGHPRFKSRNRFNSFEFKQFGVGAKLDGRRLKRYGIGRVRVRWHRPIEGDIKTARIVHSAGKWHACFACEVPTPEPLPETGHVIGLDMGISALITTSDGEKIENPKFYRSGQTKLRVLQRTLARAKRGSQNRRKALLRVQRQHEHVAHQRKDYLNKLVYALVQPYDGIAVEDLRIKNMVRNPHLSTSILDSGWYYFRERLTHKAANAGRRPFLRKGVAFVNPAHTSDTCFRCGTSFENFTLATRWVECACGGLSLDSDHHAAIAVLSRTGWVTSVSRNAAPLPLSFGRGKGKRATEAQRL
jgi:putative transposase